jgi:hypothetical protein
MPTYDKSHFEAGLTSLGSLPSGPFNSLHALIAKEGYSAAILNGIPGINALGEVALFGKRADYDLGAIVDITLKQLPVSCSKADGGIELAIDAAITIENPYALTAYYPQGNDGEGDAAYYALDTKLVQQIPPAMRTISEEESSERTMREAIFVGAGLFIPRSVAEQLYAARRPPDWSMSRDFEKFVRQQLPRVRIDINPFVAEENLHVREPEYLNGIHINRLHFMGSTAVAFSSGLAYRRNAQTGAIEQFNFIGPECTEFGEENPLLLQFSSTSEPIQDVKELQKIIMAQSNMGEEYTLGVHTSLPDALSSGVIQQDHVRYSPIATVDMLYDALMAPYDTAYFSELRDALRPAVSLDFIPELQRMALDQWLEVFEAGVPMRPVVTGLDKVADRAGIFLFRQPRA